MSEPTPMMKQYYRLKKESGDAVLFFRLGDFYEMFESDAREVSAILNITLTKRNGTAMCGIPYHAAQPYIARLLKAGKKIAVCEQISMPAGGKGIAERAIVEIITPGTVVDEDMLQAKQNNFLAAVALYKNNCSFSYIDSSTGEFYATSFHESVMLERLKEEIEKIRPAELILQESIADSNRRAAAYLLEKKKLPVNRYPDWCFSLEESYNKLCGLFKTVNLKGFGIADGEPALYSAGVLLDYLEDTNKKTLEHITSLQVYSADEYLGMDESTVRNLEIFSNMHDGTGSYTLLENLDFTKTSMGGRLLKTWLSKPLIDCQAINRRLDRVEQLYHHQILLANLREILKNILDTGRLLSRVGLGKAHAKDLLGLGNSLEAGLNLTKELETEGLSGTFAVPDDAVCRDIQTVCSVIGSSIMEDPSVLLTEGKMIRQGYSQKLDDLRSLRNNSRRVLDEYLEKEKKETGIGNLKIKYNKIIGHFLEVTKSQTDLVPEHFIRRQSLVGSERYTTEKLSQLESEINNASEKIIELEKELFLAVRDRVGGFIRAITGFTAFVAEMDCFCAFAYAATTYGYTKPRVNEGNRIEIIEGRHPVVENNLPPGEFIPNGVVLDPEGRFFIMLTGPNMAGKSTYLRQIALIVLMAQIGSFIPAREADIGAVDKIFCRVGASDNLSRGESTFLVEMNETSNILRSATEKSLVIMDEVGRGTSTRDGLSIAWAVSEYILHMLKSKTLFATHFHELTNISHPGLRPMYMTIRENEGEIIFLKKVSDGVNANSYGIQVAKLAGLPGWVIQRSMEKMGEMKNQEPVARQIEEPSPQGELFDPLEIVGEEIGLIDFNNITPMDALRQIEIWQKALKNR